MKILGVVTYLTRRGGGMYDGICQLQRTLAQLPDIENSVWGVADPFLAADGPAWAPVPVRAFRSYGPSQFEYAPAMRRQLLEADADIVDANGLWTYPSVAVSAWHRKYRRPYIISPHGMLDPWAVRNSGWKKRLALACYEKENLQHAGCVRVLCESEAKAVRQFGLENPICVLPYGIVPPPRNEGMAAPFADFARGRRVLLYLGRLHPKKGLENLLQGWKLACENEPAQAKSWILAIAGWDQNGHEAHLKQIASEKGLDGSVCFLGPQFAAAKAACYHNCDAFILPSFSEGLPVVVLEAWSYRKPVLLTPQCNFPEGFSSGAALRIEADVQSISTGLKELFEMSDADQRAMGERGFALVQERFVWPGIATQMQQVYAWLLGGGSAPECVQK